MAAEPELTGGRSARIADRVARLNAPDRLAGVDLARALAVGGMLAAHLATTQDLDWSDASTYSGLVDGRSSILFAVLAGVSIALSTGGPRPVAGDERRVARARLAVRAAVIWMLGILVISLGVPVYVILPAYGILFLLAIPAVGLSRRALFALAALTALVAPFVVAALTLAAEPGWQASPTAAFLGWWYPFPLWIAFVLLGMGLGRGDLAARFAGVRIALGGVGLALLGYGTAAALGIHESPPEPPAIPVDAAVAGATEAPDTVWSVALDVAPHSGGVFEVVGSAGFALVVLGLALFVCRARWVRWVTLPLRAVGTMPLTAYVGQLVAWAVAATAFGLAPPDLLGFRALDPLPWFLVGTVVFCTAWALLVGRGPLEGLVRAATSLIPSPARR